MATMGLNHTNLSDKDILQRGLYVYALYRTMCTLKHTDAEDKEHVFEMMCQFARQGTAPESMQCDSTDEPWEDTI